MTELFHAITDLERTCVGTGNQEPPFKHGNCFSVKAEDGRTFRIVNFYAENLDELRQRGLKFPIVCKTISERSAVVHDGRIGERWYANRYCEVCCRSELLPSIQRDIHERDVARGIRTEARNWVSYDLTRKAEFE